MPSVHTRSWLLLVGTNSQTTMRVLIRAGPTGDNMIQGFCDLWVWPWIIAERWRKMVAPELLRWLDKILGLNCLLA